MKLNLATDIGWVIFSVFVAYLGLKYDSRPSDIGFERLVGPAIFILAGAVAVGSIKRTVIDLAKLLRESATRARREEMSLARMKGRAHG